MISQNIKIKDLNSLNKRRIKIAHYYDNLIKNIKFGTPQIYLLWCVKMLLLILNFLVFNSAHLINNAQD